MTLLNDLPSARPLAILQSAKDVFANPEAAVTAEPTTREEARIAVDTLTQLFATAPGVFKKALEGARAGAEVLSTDRLQGLGELIQNADDAGATWIKFDLLENELRVEHNGRSVTLKDVLALATPWLTTKSNDASAVGRFGIGLMTLRALSPSLHVFSGPYAISLGEPDLSWLEESPEGLDDNTLIRLPLADGALSLQDLESWISKWDDTALLFCSSLREASVLSRHDHVGVLTLSWNEVMSQDVVVGEDICVVRERTATSSNGRRWSVHTADVPASRTVARKRKAAADTTPIGIALPLAHNDHGMVYAGLPLGRIVTNARINAQFDPTASRQGIAETEWNEVLHPLIVDVWKHAVLKLFKESPSSGWGIAPTLPADPAQMSPLDDLILETAREHFPAQINIHIAEADIPLSDLAVEDPALTGVITDEEIAELAERPAALPAYARDTSGQWRKVLDDWRNAGADLPTPVDLNDALSLFRHHKRDYRRSVSLLATAIRAGLETEVAKLTCIVLSDDTRVRPPKTNDSWLLTRDTDGFAHALGIAKVLHPVYFEPWEDGKDVLTWLERIGALSQSDDGVPILKRLAQAGIEGRRIENVLSDDQLIALRDALERLPNEFQKQVGGGIGKAVLVRGFHFDARGKRSEIHISPSRAYIPRGIEKEKYGFATAAGAAPGIYWLNNQYSEILKSTYGRAGLGPSKFMRLLGAETAPRLQPHPGQVYRYADRRAGLDKSFANSPPARREAMNRLEATYTLEDKHSPDLVAVLTSIAQERKGKSRRQRAAALLSTLGRAWDRLEEHSEVAAALDYQYWQVKGKVQAYWVWEAGEISWLDDSDGKPNKPSSLRRRTPATVSVHGADAAGYLHKDLHDHRVEILQAFGVAGDPDMDSLVTKLRHLRVGDNTDHEALEEASVIYRTLAQRLGDGAHLPGDLSPSSLAFQFASAQGLILTRMGWKRPNEVLNGDPIFGRRRAFVPVPREARRLWSLLKVRNPALSDAVEVLAELARTKPPLSADNLTVMLETLRLAADKASDPFSTQQRRKLASLPMWTSSGWVSKRPIFVIENPAIAKGLGAIVPIWEPGGEVSQFQRLFEPLRLTLISNEGIEIIRTNDEYVDDEATILFQSATRLLKDDLVRNEPTAANRLIIAWEQLNNFDVRILPGLSVNVQLGERNVAVDVRAFVVSTMNAIYLADPVNLGSLDGGGSAIASLFNTDRRRIALAWLAAYQRAREGKQAADLRLAHERAEIEEKAIAARMAAFQQRTLSAHKRSSASSSNKTPAPAPLETVAPTPSTPIQQTPVRRLVQPGSYRVVDAKGEIKTENRAGGAKPVSGGRSLPGTSSTPAIPSNSSTPRGYTEIEKEEIGLELLREVLATDAHEIKDLRAQRGLGADAVDLENRFYELKVHSGAEPNQITLEGSQVRRAIESDDFFLVVVSNVEEGEQRPMVRIILNPLAQLKIVQQNSLTLEGVKDVRSIVYEFERMRPAD